MLTNSRKKLLVLISLAVWYVSLASADCRHTWKPWSPDKLLQYIPATAALVVTVDWDEIRSSPLLAALVPGGERSLPGLGKLGTPCGDDRTRKIRAWALALPGDPRLTAPGQDELGVVVGGDFDQSRLVHCARKTLMARGSSVEQQRDRNFVVLSEGPEHTGVLAVEDGGPVVLAGKGFLGAMLAAAHSERPNVASSKVHASLRRDLRPAVAVLTWRRTEDPHGAPFEWLGRNPQASAVEAIGVALRLEPPMGLDAVVRCPTFEQCADVAAALDRAGRRLLHRLLRGSGSPPVLELTAGRTQVRVGLALTPKQLAALTAALASLLAS